MFRLASFRTSNDGRGDFLLFEGLHMGGAYRCFALLEYMLRGHALLLGEPTQVGILSDGMTAVCQPNYCLLDRLAANGPSALARARVPGFSATDWERTVLHRQGRYTVFADRLTALETASSATVTLDWALGEHVKAERLDPGYALLKVEGAGAANVVHEMRFSGDRAVKLASNLPDAQVRRSDEEGVLLCSGSKGDHLDIAFQTDRDLQGHLLAEFLSYRKCGLFKVQLDGVVLAPEIDAYCASVRAVPMSVGLGPQTLKAGRHVLRLETLGPAPESDGCRIGFRGLKLLDRPGTARFVLGMSQKLTATIGPMGTTIGSGAGRGLLRAAWSGAMNKGQDLILFSLIAPATGEAQTGNCLAIAPGAAALAVEGAHAMAAVGPHEDIRAGIAVLATDHLTAYEATRCGPLLASDRPVDADWDFNVGTLAVDCPAQATLTLSLESPEVRWADGKAAAPKAAGTGWTLAFEAGRHVLVGAKPRAAVLDENRRRLAAVFAEAQSARRQAPVIGDEPVKVTAPVCKPAWQTQVGDFPFDMKSFQSGGKPFVAVAAGRNVLVLDDAGAVRQELQADDLVKVVHYWPETGLLAAGCHDFRVIAFDPATGRRRWVFQSTDINPVMKKAGASGWYDRNPAGNRGIHALNSGVFLDGKSQLLVGTASTVEALDAEGKLLQSMNAGPGVVTSIALLDCPEGEVRLFPARLLGRFFFQQTSSRDPEKSFGVMVGPFAPWRRSSAYSTLIGSGYADVQAMDLDGDGRQELVGLFNGLLNGVHVWDGDGKVAGTAALGDGPRSPLPSWDKEIPTLTARGLAIADLDGDGRKELCVITSRGFVIALTGKCEKLWARRLPCEPLSIVAVDASGRGEGLVAVGLRDGTICQLDAKGRFTAKAQLQGSVLKAVALSESRIAVATSQGQAVALDVR